MNKQLILLSFLGMQFFCFAGDKDINNNSINNNNNNTVSASEEKRIQNIKNGMFECIIMFAATNRDFVEELIGNDSISKKYGFDIDEPLIRNNTVLAHAAGMGVVTAIEILHKQGAKIDATDSDGMKLNPFHAACIGAQLGSLQRLVQLYGNKHINDRDIKGNTPLHFAAVRSKKEIMNFLENNGADKTIKNNENLTAYDIVEKQKNQMSNIRGPIDC